ncbi:MAG: hypothetical protein JWR01_1364, partial [Subtercola sp.]|nr:hypothetical protein [Subtercola sp.]
MKTLWRNALLMTMDDTRRSAVFRGDLLVDGDTIVAVGPTGTVDPSSALDSATGSGTPTATGSATSTATGSASPTATGTAPGSGTVTAAGTAPGSAT